MTHVHKSKNYVKELRRAASPKNLVTVGVSCHTSITDTSVEELLVADPKKSATTNSGVCHTYGCLSEHLHFNIHNQKLTSTLDSNPTIRKIQNPSLDTGFKSMAQSPVK